MEYDEYAELIRAALCDLRTAALLVDTNTKPTTPAPRPRQFAFSPHVLWPAIVANRVYWHHVRCPFGSFPLPSGVLDVSVSVEIMKDCGHQPRLVLRALRRIQAATAWCMARRQGRLRAAAQIMQAQQRHAEVLDAEATMRRLAG